MVWGKRMKRALGDGGWAFAVWWSLKGKAGRKQRRGWNDETGESVKTGWWRGGKVKWNAWLQKAVGQNSWIIDAYNSRQKLKIEDKCTDINDGIHCIRPLDGISCMLTVASVPLRAKTRPVSKPCETVTCAQHPAGHVHVHMQVLVFKAERQVITSLAAAMFPSWRHVPAVTRLPWNSARLPEELLSYFYIYIFLIKY